MVKKTMKDKLLEKGSTGNFLEIVITILAHSVGIFLTSYLKQRTTKSFDFIMPVYIMEIIFHVILRFSRECSGKNKTRLFWKMYNMRIIFSATKKYWKLVLLFGYDIFISNFLKNEHARQSKPNAFTKKY